MSKEIRGLFIINADVVITERPWEEVVDLPGNVEDVAHPGGETQHQLITSILSRLDRNENMRCVWLS